ncbi:eukaryotic mitochondrial regulator protein-domain-containing protein [Durotheca rogersii]|uniref:eukaryotic mitochondrial regulator protein-domain-containing protein n=1 Tax=Durotheca rogersii TaxID=419775 RepID=UPI002220969B|nr:eukaryotic mitochondrial regulator protein-domain-containing protein [Durotheca rogersii]KAI5867713.1 eukaryotic mitochondrial regulator protein-domain-containing protein [Durotheca rogersii]
MPPRIPRPSISSTAPAALTRLLPRPRPTTSLPSHPLFFFFLQHHQSPPAVACARGGRGRASFSTSAPRQRFTELRRRFMNWISGPGTVYRRHRPGSTNYLQARADSRRNVDRPFPLNPMFRSRPVLDDRARELIWHKIVVEGESVKAVSAELGVDIRRVGAIVRLKEVERDWIAKGKKLARPYAKAVLSMLPTHSFRQTQQNQPFEPINELHVHPYTMKQMFWPTSESRHFTRADAAQAFHNDLLPADERVPHPELIQMEKELLQGVSPYDAAQNFKEAVRESERKASEAQVKKIELEEQFTTRVHSGRFEFRFKQIDSSKVGPTGRARNAVGWRYGAPYYDRSRGQIKIPTSVP